MGESSSEKLTKSRLRTLRDKWSRPDRSDSGTWDFDGVYTGIGSWMGYSHEMQEGLDNLGTKSFDELVINLGEKLGRKPHVIDLMGGAYFLGQPENVGFLTGIRTKDKDDLFIDETKGKNSEEAHMLEKIIKAPNRRVIEADVLSNKGWRIIEEAEIPKADLLVCRPVGPFDNKRAMTDMLDEPRAYAGLYQALFDRMLKLVNKNTGVIFTEIPDIYEAEEIKDFFTRVDKEEGSKTKIFTVPDEDYHWGGRKRKYALIQFGT